MDEEEFLKLTGWLAAAEAPSDVSQARDEFAQFYGYNWHADQDKLKQFFQYLNEGEDTRSLLSNLRQADSSAKQAAWLADVMGEIQSVSAQSQGAESESRYTAAEYDDNYQLYYRYDQQDGVYQWSADPASGSWMSQAKADEYARAAAARRQEEAAAPVPDPYSAPEWDGNYQLYYRYDPVAGVYEWSSDGRDGWMTQAAADGLYAARVQAAPTAQAQAAVPVEQAQAAGQAEAEPVAEEVASPELVEEIADMRENALGEVLAEIRESGIGPDQISDEEIVAMFDEAMRAKLGG